MTDSIHRLLATIVILVLAAASTRGQERQAGAVPAGPLTLEQVLQLAQARSEAIEIARTGVRRSEGEQMRARSGRFPQLSASASYDRALASEFSGVFGGGSSGPTCDPFRLDPAAALPDRVAEIERAIDCGAIGRSFFSGGDDVDLPFGRKNTWRLNLVFSQSVYSGGRLGALSDLAAAGRESADLALTGARAQVLFEATQAFYEAALSERLIQIAEATVAQADATVRQVQASFEAGSQPEFELLRARVARDNQRPAVIRQRVNRDIAMLRLEQLLDMPAGSKLQLAAGLDGAVPPAPAFAERVAAWEAAALASTEETARTAVKEIATLVRSREASLRAALAERRPSVTINSNYSNVTYPSAFFPTGDIRTNWTIGASIDFPILTGGRQRGSEMIARAELDQTRLQLQQTRELALLDTKAAQTELTAARAVFDASGGTVDQARRAYQIAEVRYQSGVSTQLELSDARLLLQQAETTRAQAARDLQIARARIALLPDLPFGVAGNATALPPPVAAPPQSGGQRTRAPMARTGGPGGGGQ